MYHAKYSHLSHVSASDDSAGLPDLGREAMAGSTLGNRGQEVKAPKSSGGGAPAVASEIMPEPTLRYCYERLVAMVCAGVTVVYLLLKWYTFLTAPSTLWVSLPLILSQTYFSVVSNTIVCFIVFHRMRRVKRRLPELGLAPSELPTVDVLIPCLNEPVEVG
jgi:hypothetical protein